MEIKDIKDIGGATTLLELAFDRKRIIRALESYNTRIFEHAVKIIVLPESRDVAQWRRELLAWAGYLASLRIKKKHTLPMGVELAYDYLYSGPFVGNEAGMTAHFIRMVEVSQGMTLGANATTVHTRLKEFLTQLAGEIGSGGNVEATILNL